MEDDISQIDNKITQLKQKKEKIKTQKALFLFKEAQTILGDKFSYELVLSVLSHAWSPSSDKQKEEWIKSAHKFWRINKRQTEGKPNPRSETSQTTEENP